MKRTALIVIVALVAFASGAFADITNTASVVSNDLPRGQFYDQVNKAMYQITAVDQPAVFAAVNFLSNRLTNVKSAVITNVSVGFTNKVFVNGGLITNITYTGSVP